jgi:hypothetical protein
LRDKLAKLRYLEEEKVKEVIEEIKFVITVIFICFGIYVF